MIDILWKAQATAQNTDDYMVHTFSKLFPDHNRHVIFHEYYSELDSSLF